ncbi:MAG: hypothetical protein HFI65_07130 [Lachnospiraceae bacterium]|nr:hypothetical protein [Lachnospiraceae bacterium]
MLNVELSEKIIDRLTECTGYNINIMDERGIILAPACPSPWIWRRPCCPGGIP